MINFDDIQKKIDQLSDSFKRELKEKQSKASDLLKDKRLNDLFKSVKELPVELRAEAGSQLNKVKKFVQQAVDDEDEQTDSRIEDFDVTAPFEESHLHPGHLIDPKLGSIHPSMRGIDQAIEVFGQMGFGAIESIPLDSQYNMFDSLNFLPDHPTRDQFDTFWLDQKDAAGKKLLAPGHCSAMQNRILRKGRSQLEAGDPIAMLIPGRVFRHDDIDITHDHIFYQLEGVYVHRKVSVAHLLGTLTNFFEIYFQKSLEYKLEPFYFSFTEPSLEVIGNCLPKRTNDKSSDTDEAGWMELLGAGLIHPNVLSEAGIDPKKYSGFAFGIGFTRLVMTRYEISDIRLLFSGKIDFLRQF